MTSGCQVEDFAKTFEVQNDDYCQLWLKHLETGWRSLAEMMHKKARDFWGFGKDEDLSTSDLILEKYRGIRPAPGYPACPDHTEKQEFGSL